ncbi:MAG: TadE/TadG family type IV pilus assembly protein [Acidobacteriaceae bacterium]
MQQDAMKGRLSPLGRKRRWRGLLRESGGQSLIEIAVMMPILTLLMAYAVDFGYFFIAAANITSSARNATEYSVMGFSGPSQSSVPPAGPISTTNSVAALAMGDLASLLDSSTTTTVQVCSKALGMNGNLPKCASYGVAGATYTPAADPEAPIFVLQRVDVTYTVQPPVPLSFFGASLLPTLKFHRQVSMRAMD